MSDMTPKEVQAAGWALAKEVGGEGAVYAAISRYKDDKPCEVDLYAEGLGHGRTFAVNADTWLEAFSMAHEKWAEVKERTVAGKIESMALEIIRVTAIKGTCQGADLRTAKFTQDDITRYGSMACAKADAMANNGPFSIAPEAKANAA